MSAAPGGASGEAFTYRADGLYCEGVPLAAIAQRHGTPAYVYSAQAVRAAYRRYVDALEGRRSMVCYAMKANANLAILDLLARAGSGFDIVSGGELARALAVGADPARIVFSGVGKTEREIAAALEAGIGCFNVESEAELVMIDAAARAAGRRAPVSLRVNPDVDPKTHRYISTGLKANKFGIPAAEAESLYRRAAGMAGLQIVGIDCHIGSQITTLEPYLEAAERVFDLVDRLEASGIALDHVDLGGGLGIAYGDESAIDVTQFVHALTTCMDRRGHRAKMLVLEPGRSIVGGAGALLMQVQVLKEGEEKRFAVVDAAMNDMMRPALYEAWMDVVPVVPRSGAARRYDVVGPVCESADWLARDRELALAPGDLLAMRCAGAYGMAMASNYNSRCRAAEVLVDGTNFHLVRRRETTADLFAFESTAPIA